jgi:hypothetical protein
MTTIMQSDTHADEVRVCASDGRNRASAIRINLSLRALERLLLPAKGVVLALNGQRVQILQMLLNGWAREPQRFARARRS